MDFSHQPALLHSHYTDLQVSEQLKSALALLKCDTLGQILKNNKASDLLALEGFDAQNMDEFYQFLFDNHMEDFLRGA